ncbi:MAG TPA: YbhB/YbcL family Raf kinase inhibitor-like protein [Bacteroidales bacterium]|nr:YbhB/YbcL family Raf kinase inhibitor-like protein [Bacteroidales bacterium]HOS20886.1 YbhB/YbcL family Raf kinase inhibitor-like protein [Bacteroidales bacterium]HOY90684.1 YbhB/YbcL family Raf kinase inhibitor-like protein [Bacteroidales bacterium]HPL03327.1 YbhB/YbcL family Raf kinase inhibitor-like protein [Bacteroidales bacterium]HPM40787.1 YbhB/YbcL family Raf kinase inhibitor-like protein [Bacteroidales bacterium]
MSTNIIVKSDSFSDGGMIPAKYTCDGANISPQLSWDNAPKGTKSFVLICEDPDAPMGTFTHWVLYDIPADVHELPENLPKDKILPNGAKQGITDFKKVGYGGPCPPNGTHRYYFKLYALDTLLNLEPALKKEDILKAMNGHILAQGQIMGKYARI